MHSQADVTLSIIYYTFCSSMMLVANKIAVFHIPVPGLLACVQLVVSVVSIFALKGARLIRPDGLDVVRARLFSPYALSFVVSVYTNMKALEASSVETVIVFRALTPLLVSVLDWLYLGRDLPDTRSLLTLVGVVVSAAGYVRADGQLVLGIRAYGWLCAYLAAIVFSMTEGKRLLARVCFHDKIWGSVLYTNALSLPGMVVLAVMSGEPWHVSEIPATRQAVLWLTISSVIGLGISWAGWNCRDKTSATAYTLIGVACKLLTVLLNVFLWDKHASPQGLFWIVVCILTSGFYRQAPLRQQEDARDKFPRVLYDMIGKEVEVDLENLGLDVGEKGEEL